MEWTLALPVIGAILLLGVVLIYNGIVAKKNEVERAWASVLTYERAKNKVVPAIERIASDFKDYEAGLQKQLVELRNAVAALDAVPAGQGSAVALVEERTKRLVNGLKVAVEAYPQVASAAVVRNVMAEIARQQENIAASLVIFNRAVERHNNAIQQFPGSLVNAALNHREPVAPFHDTEASAGFEYRP